MDRVLENANIINELQHQLHQSKKPPDVVRTDFSAYDNIMFLNDDFVSSLSNHYAVFLRKHTNVTPSSHTPIKKTKITKDVEKVEFKISVSPTLSVSTTLKAILLLLNAMMTVCSVGFVYGVGVMFVDIVDDFKSTRAETSPILMSSCIMFASGGVIGPLMTRFNSGHLCMICGVIILCGCIISSFTYSITVLIICLGFVTGCGLSVPYFLSYACVNELFEKNRNTIIAAVGISAGVGSSLFPYLTKLLIDDYGWRGVLLIYSGVLSNSIPIGLLNSYVKKRLNMAHGPSQAMHIRDALSFDIFKNMEFVMMLVCILLQSLFSPTIIQLFVDIIIDKGYTLSTGSILLSVVGFADLGGRVSGTLTLHVIKCSYRLKSSVCIVIISMASLCYVFFDQYEYVLATTILWGLAWGYYQLCYPGMIMEVTGPKYFTNALGYCNLLGGLFSLVGSPVAGYVKDSTGSYNLMFYLASLCGVICVLLMWAMMLKLKMKKKIDNKPEHIIHM